VRVGAASDRWVYDIALSFAGSDRAYVHQVAEVLTAKGLRVFLDSAEQAALLGTYLTETLPSVYRDQAAVVVMFISADYANSDWTVLERRSALERAVAERREYILPARFDATELPGILSSLVWIPLARLAPTKFAEILHQKWSMLDLTRRPASPQRGVDFLLSSVRADQAWADWMAFSLTERGFSVESRVWDDGTTTVADACAQAETARWTLAIWSTAYRISAAASSAWRMTYANEASSGVAGHRTTPVLIARVDDSELPAMLSHAPTCELFGVDQDVARSRLVAHATQVRFGAPSAASAPFPGTADRV